MNLENQSLFWCYTSDHDWDRFIQANNKKEAKEYFGVFYEYEFHEIKVSQICIVPSHFTISKPATVTVKKLRMLGFQIIYDDYPFVVRYKDRIYREGVELESWEESLEPKNDFFVYLLKIRNHDKYKIGITKDLARRRSELQKVIPFHIYYQTWLDTKHAYSIEKIIKETFAHCKIRGQEWFELDHFGFLLLKIILELLRKVPNPSKLNLYSQKDELEAFQIIFKLIKMHRIGKLPTKKMKNQLSQIYHTLGYSLKLEHLSIWSESILPRK